MPICTYLNDDACLQPTGHKVVDETLADLRKQTGDDWRVERRIYPGRRRWWFWREPDLEYFTLFFNLGHGEFQIINFYRSWSREWSINTGNSAELVVAYMHGVTAGDWPHRRQSRDASQGDAK